MYSLEELKTLTSSLKEGFSVEKGKQTAIQENKEKHEKTLEKLEKETEVYHKKVLLLNETSKEARTLSKDMFELLSTYGLQHIYGSNMGTKIKLSDDVPVTADFLVTSEYAGRINEVDPTEGEGGGVADVQALSAFFNISNTKNDINTAPWFLDEPTKFVSKGHAEDVSKFINDVSSDFERQVIMVTHDGVSKDVASKAYQIKLDENGTSQVTEVTNTDAPINIELQDTKEDL